MTLTGRQRECLLLFAAYLAAYGWPPPVWWLDQVMDGGRGYSWRTLQCLRAKGCLTWCGKRYGQARVTAAGLDALGGAT